MSLFGVIGSVLKVGSSVIPGPGGTLLSAAGSLLGGSGSKSVTNPVTGVTYPVRAVDIAPTKPSIFPTALPQLPTPDSVKVNATNIAGLYQSGSATAYFSGQKEQAGVCTLPGHHMNRTRYAVVNKGDPYVVEKGTKCVKNRRRNALNPRALNRAVSRVAAAKKYAKMLDRIEIKGRRACR